MKTPKPSDVVPRDVSAPAPRLPRLPREALTAEQGYWTAARVPRVATLAGDDESGPAPGDRRRGVSLVTRALRQVIAVLFSLAILLAVSCPALAATSVFLSNDSAGSEVTYVIP